MTKRLLGLLAVLLWGSTFASNALATGSVSDLNGDGKSDLVWYSAATGQTSHWIMNGAGISSAAVLLADDKWNVVATADINGDGKSDLIWYNQATGQTSYWMMNGGTALATGLLLTDPNWKVVAAADLNGDGKSDLIWYNAATGQTSYWLMNGASIISTGLLLTHPLWTVAAVGDLNGDGKADLVWYNRESGQTSYWLMDGGSILDAAVLLASPVWKVAAVGDLNGDGKADLIWFNAATGQTSYWLMNGGSLVSSGLLLTNADWRVITVGDLDGDGKADLLWYNALTGQTSTWLMNGPTPLNTALLLTDPNWRIAVRGSSLLSADQLAFESLAVAPGTGTYTIYWNLNYSGPETSGVNYAWNDSTVHALSPLLYGPHTATQSTPTNLTTTLALPSEAPSRFLKDGLILVVPTQGLSTRASYTGNDVQIEYLAADKTTVAWTQIRKGYTRVPLSGLLYGATDDLAHYYNSFFSNPAILKPNATYLPGAAYLKFSAFVKGDRYSVFDCNATTTDANVSPCFTGSTLTSALTSGISSTSDATTYHLSDGVVSTVGGVQVWVATNPRPVSAVLSLTPQYRVYFQLNGNVYTGALLRDGAPHTTSYYVSNPGGATVTDRLTFLDFQVRTNKAARDSIAAALNL